MEIRTKSSSARDILRAAVDGRVDLLESESDEDLVSARCNSGCTALHWAAGTDQVSVVRYLLTRKRRQPGRRQPQQQQQDFPPTKKEGKKQQGSCSYCFGDVLFRADVRATGKAQSRTPLHYACRNGCLRASRVLVEEFGAAADASAKHGVTPFQLAVWRNHLPVCRWLANECNVDCGQVNDFDCGAVHWIGIARPERADDDVVVVVDTVAQDTTTKRDGKQRAGREACLDRGEPGEAHLPLARWLSEQPGIDWNSRQRQGHTPLHKAAWLGNVALCRYLHEEHDVWDDTADDAGNYAADLCGMAPVDRSTGMPQRRHALTSDYLREHCGRDRARSCAVLGVPEGAGEREIRRAYLRAVRRLHPDNQRRQDQQQQQRKEEANGFASSSSSSSTKLSENSIDDLHAAQMAYRHLVIHKGRGFQSNPAHSLKLMLQFTTGSSPPTDRDVVAENKELLLQNDDDDDGCFKARLIAVLLEYGDKGLDLSNLKKKWKQVWPGEPFPCPSNGGGGGSSERQDDGATGACRRPHRQHKVLSLSRWIQMRAGDVVDICKDETTGGLRLHAKNCSQAAVAQAAAAAAAV